MVKYELKAHTDSELKMTLKEIHSCVDPIHVLAQSAIEAGDSKLLESYDTKEEAMEAAETVYQRYVRTNVMKPGEWPGRGWALDVTALVIWESEYDDDDGEYCWSFEVVEYAELPEYRGKYEP